MLALQENQVRGEIPPKLGSLTTLTNLRLDDKRLTGEIPPEVGGLPRLSMFMPGSSQLTGRIAEKQSKPCMNDLEKVGLSFCKAS